MIAWLLSKLFPPRMPGKVRDWEEREPVKTIFTEEGWAGNVRRKYTGIEKHWRAVDDARHKSRRIDSRQYWAQLREAEKYMATVEKDLLAQGYVNTIHDCWEKPEENS